MFPDISKVRIFLCRQPMIKIGEDITEQLAVEPPQFYVNKYIRPKYASPDRRKGAQVGIKTASPPESPVERCKADVAILAHILVNKYADHLPLYRQEQMYLRHGIRVPANTMSDWVNNCAGTLKPLYNKLKKSVLSGDYVNVDETPIDLLRKGKKKLQARLWVVRSGSGPPGMFFHFTENWQHKQAINLLEPFSGHLQTDAYAGYEKVGRRNDITLLACLAHARRRFAENAIRPVVLGKKNFLFVGSERGGETAAIFMSLIASCKVNKINPFEYLKDVLARINAHPHRRLGELLPYNWQPAEK